MKIFLLLCISALSFTLHSMDPMTDEETKNKLAQLKNYAALIEEFDFKISALRPSMQVGQGWTNIILECEGLRTWKIHSISLSSPFFTDGVYNRARDLSHRAEAYSKLYQRALALVGK
jgi:hypothetical protein